MKTLIALLSMSVVALSLQAREPFQSYDFQNFDQFYMAQKQAEIRERAKQGNIGNYEVGGTNNYYIGSANVAGLQNNTNIGNINNITGDNNKVKQESGEQANENTIN